MPYEASRAFLPSLTGLRGVASLWVLVYHVVWIAGYAVAWPALHLGYLGVDIFFVLSGFILGHVHLNDFAAGPLARAGRFLVLRLSRIYPVHLVALGSSSILAGILYALGVGLLPRFDLAYLPAHLLLVQSWGWTGQQNFNLIAWSISAEWLAYLAFPFLAFIANRMPAWIALAVAFLAIVGEVVAFRALGRSTIDDVTTLVPLRMGGEFICGLFLYVVYRRGLLARLPWAAITDLSIAGFSIAVALSAPFVAVLFIPPAILGLAHGRGLSARFMSGRRMIFLGEISYSLYMVHLLTLECVFAPIHYTRLNVYGPLFKTLVLLPALGLIALATMLMHRHVEIPARVWVRRRLDMISKRHVTVPVP